MTSQVIFYMCKFCLSLSQIVINKVIFNWKIATNYINFYHTPRYLILQLSLFSLGKLQLDSRFLCQVHKDWLPARFTSHINFSLITRSILPSLRRDTCACIDFENYSVQHTHRVIRLVGITKCRHQREEVLRLSRSIPFAVLVVMRLEVELLRNSYWNIFK